MTDVLSLFKKDTSKKAKFSLVKEGQLVEDINEATHLKLHDGNTLNLDENTTFVVDSKPISLRVVVYSWLNRNLSAASFLEDSQKRNIQTLTFLQRTDLISWLSGSAKESEFISHEHENEVKDDDSKVESIKDTEDPFLKSVLDHERNLINSNTALRGSKPVDFSNVARECEIKIIKALKRKGATGISAENQRTKKKRRNPIILISPAASAILTIKNIKPFLSDSRFVDASSTDALSKGLLSDEGDIRNISHNFTRLGQLTFLVVNNTDKFIKPEYWDRVVAVFTTGQEWQFKSYKWTDPNQLFQKVKGYYFHYSGDAVPPKVRDWNVEKIALDRTKRFKDAEVLNYFWDSLEKTLIAKGWN